MFFSFNWLKEREENAGRTVKPSQSTFTTTECAQTGLPSAWLLTSIIDHFHLFSFYAALFLRSERAEKSVINHRLTSDDPNWMKNVENLEREEKKPSPARRRSSDYATSEREKKRRSGYELDFFLLRRRRENVIVSQSVNIFSGDSLQIRCSYS